MKKYLSVLLAVLMLLPITSCTTSENTPDDESADAVSTTESEQPEETAPETEPAPPPAPEEVFDFVIDKDPNEEFTILTISDPQMLAYWWIRNTNSGEKKNFEYTMTELIKVVEPDFILCTGDFTGEGDLDLISRFGEYVDALGIPWATVFGNHDHEYADETALETIINMFTVEFENCLFSAGDREMGVGNYTIGIRENGEFVEGIFMLDSHKNQIYTDENGNEFTAEASISELQQQWYREKVELMKRLGCSESIMVTHQPLVGHQMAFYAAIENFDTYYSLLTSPECAKTGVGWKEEYADTSFGITPIGCANPSGYGHIHPDDGMHDLLKELGHTKNTICGHCHENNASVVYEGIRYTHGLKTSLTQSSLWMYDFGLNGGTVFKISTEGVTDVYHEYIPIGDTFKRANCINQVSKAPFDPEY